MNVSKLMRLIVLLPQRPIEFWDRVATVREGRRERSHVSTPTYRLTTWTDLAKGLAEVLGADAQAILAESPLQHIEACVRNNWEGISSQGPFLSQHNADLRLARICYMACRALRPDTVVETGVAYGVTTTFILAAMEVNQRGVLHSVDLPPLGKDADHYVGCLIPHELRGRWRLHRGATRRVLPRLLKTLGSVDTFIHDSLHTYQNMRMEFESVTSRLARKAVVISDDIEGNAAFAEWTSAIQPAFMGVTAEESKDSLLGVAVIHHANSLTT